jgi:hypothetical protein
MKLSWEYIIGWSYCDCLVLTTRVDQCPLSPIRSGPVVLDVAVVLARLEMLVELFCYVIILY